MRRMLMVGDTETDIVFAKASGIACCWASYGYGDMGRCRALAPQYEIAGIADLPPLLGSR
jgi:phosphoglycolate phosphatase